MPGDTSKAGEKKGKKKSPRTPRSARGSKSKSDEKRPDTRVITKPQEDPALEPPTPAPSKAQPLTPRSARALEGGGKAPAPAAEGGKQTQGGGKTKGGNPAPIIRQPGAPSAPKTDKEFGMIEQAINDCCYRPFRKLRSRLDYILELCDRASYHCDILDNISVKAEDVQNVVEATHVRRRFFSGSQLIG